jgi:Sugar phosphate isomerases/epimerases
MKLGICCDGLNDETKIKNIAKAGFTFIESGLCGMSTASEGVMDTFGELLDKYGLYCRSTNGMFPSDIKLIGNNIDTAKIEDYLYHVFEKTKKFNIEVCVLGSGRARTVPEGVDIEKAYDQFAEVISETIAPIIERYHKTLAIEPLRYCECNIVNTVADSMKVVKAVNKPNVKTLIDYFHVGMNGEDINTFVNYQGDIKHVHIASPSNMRKFPSPDDGDDYQAFFDILRKAKYQDECISIEGDGGNSDSEFLQSLITSYHLLSKL